MSRRQVPSWASCSSLRPARPRHGGITGTDDDATPVFASELGRLDELKRQTENAMRDYVHLVNKDAFKIDIEQDGKTRTPEEIERLYRDHIIQVEMVQLEQMAVLRTLIKHHGLREVLSEGLAPAAKRTPTPSGSNGCAPSCNTSTTWSGNWTTCAKSGRTQLAKRRRMP